jgi:hypothetical protein
MCTHRHGDQRRGKGHRSLLNSLGQHEVGDDTSLKNDLSQPWLQGRVAIINLSSVFEGKVKTVALQKSYVLPHMWTLDQGQTQQGDWTMST